MAEGCIKDEMKAKCQKVVMFISVVLFIIAVVMIGYAAAVYGGVDEKVSAAGYEAPFKFEKD